MRSERDAAGDEGRGPAPGFGSGGRGVECEQGRCRWTNKGVDGLPDGIDVGDFVGEKVDRKSTRLNSSHQIISYAVFCLKKKKERETVPPMSGVKSAERS